MNNFLEKNHTMLFDFYELTMGNGYFNSGYKDKITYFDLFYRTVPDNGGFAISAGLEQAIEYIKDLHFSENDIEFLRGKNLFSEDFLDYLRGFHFSGDLWAVPEGTPIFPREPIITVRAPAIEAQFIETFLLLTMNHQSLIATKANRIVRSADGRPVIEFGSRRAQGVDAAVLGARAAFIGGCVGTACTLSDLLYGVTAAGTMAHSWVQLFPTQLDAFKTYCRMYPKNSILLIDTYDTLRSGVPDAIRAFDEVLRPLGITDCGVRLDSGDIAYLSKKTRQMLDEAGWPGCKITCSNSLDEHLIADLLRQGACVDSFGVGERLITSKSSPVFDGVYKLSAVEEADGTIVPRIKVSENVGKVTNPHYKRVYRFFNRDTGMAEADYIAIHDEVIDDTQPLVIKDPEATWKQKEMTNFRAVELQVPIFKNGELVYKCPSLPEIQSYCKTQVATLWPEVLRFDNPHEYYVDLSDTLLAVKNDLLNNR